MSYNKTKTDPELGQRVHEHLVKMGVETPIKETGQIIDRKGKIEVIEGVTQKHESLYQQYEDHFVF